jgi:lipopolysaccharide export system permease protein
MSILKKHIITEWLRFFVSSTFVLFLLITITNLISGFLRGNVTPIEVIINHLLELPGSFNRIFPISCLIASLFSINKLKNRNELTAIFAAGYSRKKFIIAIVQISFCVSIVQFITASYLYPLAKQNKDVLIENSGHKFRNLKRKGLIASTLSSGRAWYKSKNYYFSFRAFSKTENSLYDISLYYFDNNYHLKERIKAKNAIYSKDNAWILNNGIRYSFLNNEKFPTATKFTSIPLYLNETPEDFLQIEADITTLSVFDLYLYINKLKGTGINTNEYEVIFLDKFSSSLICIIFALIALIGIFNPNRRNSSFGKNLIFVFLFTIFYWLIYSYFLELGKSSKLNPFLSCFSVPILFSFYLVFYFNKNKKLQ